MQSKLISSPKTNLWPRKDFPDTYQGFTATFAKFVGMYPKALKLTTIFVSEVLVMPSCCCQCCRKVNAIDDAWR